MEQSEPVAQPPQDAPRHATHPWARPVMWMVVFAIFTGAGLYVFTSCRNLPGDMATRSGKTIREVGHALADVAAAFRRGTITTSFVSYATSLTNQQYLQFATLKQMEIFTQTEAPSTGFGYIPLPEVVVEARVPVEYTYFLDLKGEWKFVLEDNTIHVFAPAIRFNKPAPDISQLRYEVKKGYLKTDAAQERLQSSITSLVILRAKDNIPLVKETGRRQTEEFVQTWLAKAFSDGKQYPIKVYFPGEMPPKSIEIIRQTEQP